MSDATDQGTAEGDSGTGGMTGGDFGLGDAGGGTDYGAGFEDIAAFTVSFPEPAPPAVGPSPEEAELVGPPRGPDVVSTSYEAAVAAAQPSNPFFGIGPHEGPFGLRDKPSIDPETGLGTHGITLDPIGLVSSLVQIGIGAVTGGIGGMVAGRAAGRATEAALSPDYSLASAARDTFFLGSLPEGFLSGFLGPGTPPEGVSGGEGAGTLVGGSGGDFLGSTGPAGFHDGLQAAGDAPTTGEAAGQAPAAGADAGAFDLNSAVRALPGPAAAREPSKLPQLMVAAAALLELAR